MRRPEIRILTRSPRRFAARCRIFLVLGISVLEYGSETVTHRRATGQGSTFSQESIPPPIPPDDPSSEADRSSCHRVGSASPCSLCLSSVPFVLSLFFSHRSLSPSSVGG